MDSHSVLASTVCTVILTVGTRKGRLGRGKQQLLTVGNKIGQPTTGSVGCLPSRSIVDLKPFTSIGLDGPHISKQSHDI